VFYSINHQHASSFYKYDFELLHQLVHNIDAIIQSRIYKTNLRVDGL